MILKTYKKNSSYTFPFLEGSLKKGSKQEFNMVSAKTALINKYQKIAEKLGINRKLSSHTARHSFSEMARNKKIDMRSLQLLLGHSSVKTAI